jgi:hypothetical protein
MWGVKPRYLTAILQVIAALLFAHESGASQAKTSISAAGEEGGLLTRIGEAPWSFRVIPFAWIPSEIDFQVKDGPINEHASLSTSDLLGVLEAAAEFQGEVRKGPIGGFISLIYLTLNGETGDRATIDVDDDVFLWNYGITFEVADWSLGAEPSSPNVRLEPFGGGRTLADSIRVNTVGRTRDVELNFTTPVVGLKTYWDLDEHWNLELAGDYGGFGVDDVRATWQVTGVAGYRFDAWGVPVNFLAGYRYLYINYKKDGVELDVDGHGPIVGLALEF